MYALAVQSIPEGKEWLNEVKFDGYRYLAGQN
jgi:ATP-dependent DNA ligase